MSKEQPPKESGHRASIEEIINVKEQYLYEAAAMLTDYHVSVLAREGQQFEYSDPDKKRVNAEGGQQTARTVTIKYGQVAVLIEGHGGCQGSLVPFLDALDRVRAEEAAREPKK